MIQRRFFHRLGLHSALIDALKVKKCSTPLPIQKKAIPLICQGRDVVIAAETGSGKTLSYVLPLLHNLKTAEMESQYDASSQQEVKGLILVPSHVLAVQAWNVIHSLDPVLASKTTLLSTKGHAFGSEKKPVMVIATPRRLVQETRPSDLASLETLVIDEADVLLEADYQKYVMKILGQVRNRSHEHAVDEALKAGKSPEKLTQLLLVAASIPENGKKSLKQWIQYRFPGMQYAVTDGFHKSISTVEESFVHLKNEEVSETQERRAILTEILAAQDPSHGTLVFVNTVTSAQEVHAWLQSQTFSRDSRVIHKLIPAQERAETLQAFERGHVRCIVSTDVSARGIDLPNVDHVIQLEFAKDAQIYLHRNGRTARAGASGKVTNVVGEKDALLVSHLMLSKTPSSSGAKPSSLVGVFSRKRRLRKAHRKQSFVTAPPCNHSISSLQQ